MPRKPAQPVEDQKVDTTIDTATDLESGEDLDSIMAALRAEIKEKQAKVKQVREKVRAAKGEKPIREPKAPKAAKSLDEIIAAQAQAPRASAVQRFVRAAHARVAAGQPIAEAVQGVMEQYSAIVLEILTAMSEAGLSGRDATIAHFEANFPTVSSGRKRTTRKPKSQVSDAGDSDEQLDAGEDDDEEDDFSDAGDDEDEDEDGED